MGKYPTLDKAVQDMESTCPNVSFLTMLPKVETSNEQQVGLIAHNEPKSGAAEAFRFLRTKFKYLNPDSPSKTVLITSSVPVEGKTIVASNMAIVLANLGKKVLLVDADLRRPSLHKIFNNVDREQGLSELLIRDGELDNILSEIVKDTEIEHLSLITSGIIPSQSPADLLDSERMRELIRLLTEQYDYVIFDSPPVLAVADPTILSIWVDYIIYVFDIAKTKKGSITGGLKTLTEFDAHRPIGAVCNLAKKSGARRKT